MDDNQLLRYSRQILLSQIDIAGQQKLLDSRALIIGLGGLGSPVAMYLAASGVGRLTIVDHDKVELSNLQRQIVHATPALGEEKTASAARQLKALNPEIEITAINRRLDDAELLEQVRAVQVVVDASDNFGTRFAINRACVAAKRPLVSGAVVRFEGQVAVFRPDLPDSPCYRCLYADTNAPEETCGEFGVLAPAAGVIGSLQATETIKVLLDIGQTLAGRLLVLDLLNMEWRTLRLRKDPACPVCASR